MGRLPEGLIATARTILLGMAMDVIYQFLVFKTFYPAQALLIALLLAFIPYLLIRGPATLIVRWWHGGASGNQNESVCVAHSGRIRRERTGAD